MRCFFVSLRGRVVFLTHSGEIVLKKVENFFHAQRADVQRNDEKLQNFSKKNLRKSFVV